MAFALMSLMAQMLAATLIVYWVALLVFRGKSLTRSSKVAGFLIALPTAAIAAMVLSPSPVSASSALQMFWPSVIIGSCTGAGLIAMVGKRKATAQTSDVA